MTKHVNRSEVIGNLGRTPDVRSTQDGRKVVVLSVATDESWTEKGGEKKSRTEWHRVVIYNQHYCELAEKHLYKGHLVRLVGKLRTRKWSDDSKIDRYTTEIVLSDYDAELTLLHSKAESEAA